MYSHYYILIEIQLVLRCTNLIPCDSYPVFNSEKECDVFGDVFQKKKKTQKQAQNHPTF